MVKTANKVGVIKMFCAPTCFPCGLVIRRPPTCMNWEMTVWVASMGLIVLNPGCFLLKKVSKMHVHFACMSVCGQTNAFCCSQTWSWAPVHWLTDTRKHTDIVDCLVLWLQLVAFIRSSEVSNTVALRYSSYWRNHSRVIIIIIITGQTPWGESFHLLDRDKLSDLLGSTHFLSTCMISQITSHSDKYNGFLYKQNNCVCKFKSVLKVLHSPLVTWIICDVRLLLDYARLDWLATWFRWNWIDATWLWIKFLLCPQGIWICLET